MSKQDKPAKDFDAVAWTRAVRDELHGKYGHLPTAEFLQKLSEEGHQSVFGQQMARKFRKVDSQQELISSS